MKLNLKYNNFLDLINLEFKAYYPLNGFVSKKDFLSISKKYKLINNKFFPMPVFIGISSKLYNLYKKQKTLEAYYKSKKVCDLKIKSFYKIDKKNIGKLIFKTKSLQHPGLKEFLKSGEYNIECKVIKFNKKIMTNLNFSYPKKLKRKFKKYNFNSIVGFHTRNAPHRAHEWIHNYGLKKCDALLIQPMIGQFKKNEYKEKAIIETNRKLVNTVYKKKNIIFSIFNSYPRYAGPREALFHALIRKNYGCTHFLVGRDHAGVGKYYQKYESQKICKRYENKIKIKIISFKEPYLCDKCKNIINSKCIKCKNSKIKFVKGTLIRNMLSKSIAIPSHYMRKEISKILKKNSII